MCSALNTKTLILWQDAEQTFSVSRSPFGFLVILTHSSLHRRVCPNSIHTHPSVIIASCWEHLHTCVHLSRVGESKPYTQLIHCFAVKLTSPALMLTTRWERCILTLKSCVLLNYYVKSTPIIQI